MIIISKKQKQVIKWLFVIAIIAIIIYSFRDMAGPIFEQLKETSPLVVIATCIASIGYELLEGWVTYGFAKQYNPQFRYIYGVELAFYGSFYRVATLGSGAGVAALYYLNEKNIPVPKGTGMYMLQYVFHKISIAIFSGIFFLLSFGYMKEYYGEYEWLLIGGYVLTVIIALAMVFICCSKQLHKGILWLLHKVNRMDKLNGKIEYLKEQFIILEDATEFLLQKKVLVLCSIGKNLLKLACWYGIPFLLFYGEYDITLLQVWAITSLSVMLAAVVPSPAGIGSTELLFTMLFAMVVGTGEAGSASLLYRFATFMFPFLVGAVVVIARRFHKKSPQK